MNYFLQEWVTGNIPDNDWEKAKISYQKHLDTILPKCSASVKKLAREINLHDGLINHCIVDRQAAQLDVIIRCGDLQSGYFDISLQYLQVRFSMDEIHSLANLARSRHVELLYDELDLDESRKYIHRMLFSTSDEISITFSGFKIKKKKQPNRSLPFVGDPFKTKLGTHSDGTICLENTKSVPQNFVACCDVFAGHTNTCAYDIRYKWLSNSNEWVIVIPESAGGSGITMFFCPHCGKSL